MDMMMLPVKITENKKNKSIRIIGVLAMFPWFVLTFVPLGILCFLIEFVKIIKKA